MIVVDASPFVYTPGSGVARALAHLLRGWQALPDAEPPLVLRPEPGTGPRLWRRALARAVDARGATGLYSPWSAFAPAAVPIVACVHEVPFVRQPALEGRLRGRRHRRWLARNVERCAAIVVPSHATRNDVLTVHPEAADRVHVVPGGFDPAPWKAAQATRHGTGARPYALFLGLGTGRRGARKKGLDVACAAWAGDAPGGVELVLAAHTAPPRHAPLRFVPSPDDDTLAALLAGATCLLYPSRSEGFGYPPLEAMAAGVPVVATSTGSIPEVVGEAALLVAPGDADALGQAVSALASDASLRARLIAAGRAQCERFPPEATARRIVAHFAAGGVRA